MKNFKLWWIPVLVLIVACGSGAVAAPEGEDAAVFVEVENEEATVLEYDIVANSTRSGLVEDVNALLEEGWRVQGSPFSASYVAPRQAGTYLSYLQAVVKRRIEDE